MNNEHLMELNEIINNWFQDKNISINDILKFFICGLFTSIEYCEFSSKMEEKFFDDLKKTYLEDKK